MNIDINCIHWAYSITEVLTCGDPYYAWLHYEAEQHKIESKPIDWVHGAETDSDFYQTAEYLDSLEPKEEYLPGEYEPEPEWMIFNRKLDKLIRK